MKKILWCLIAPAVIMMQSCEEKGVVIDMGSKGKVKDTSYSAAVETPQARIVLIEEFTGSSCTNCPAGHVAVANILSTNPGRVIAVAYHTFNGGKIFEPVSEGEHKSHYDFRNTEATDIGTNIYNGVGSIPVGGVDRTVVGGTRQLNRTEWAGQVDARLPVATPVNLHLTSVYNSGNNEVTVTVKVVYTGTVSKKNNLTIEVIENGIIDAQAYPDRVDMEYVHTHLLRKLLTPLYYGVSIPDDVMGKVPGRVYEYTYTFEPDAAWNMDNCQVVAFVANNEDTDKEVLQAIETHLK
jgi:hypothetical protein